jgi:hypothetical protein
MGEPRRPGPPRAAIVAVGARVPQPTPGPAGPEWRVSADEPWPPLRRGARMMSRGALLASGAVHDALFALRAAEAAVGAAPVDPLQIGIFLGVGASAGSMEDVLRLLRPALQDGQWSGAAFARRGVGACNPTLAFQLMNNFTLAHPAILEGLGGPNGAVFSRGVGTTLALREAMWALQETDAPYVIAGGADSALHPVTASELRRLGTRRPLGEGAAVFVLAREAQAPLGWIERAEDIDEPSADEPSADEPFADEPFEALAAGPALAWLRTLERGALDRDAAEALHRDADGLRSRVTFTFAPGGSR